MPPTKGGPHCRLSSPNGGGSTLMTSAPMSASNMEQTGPDRIRERSTTKRSSSGLVDCVSMYFFLDPSQAEAKAYQLYGPCTPVVAKNPRERAEKLPIG